MRLQPRQLPLSWVHGHRCRLEGWQGWRSQQKSTALQLQRFFDRQVHELYISGYLDEYRVCWCMMCQMQNDAQELGHITFRSCSSDLLRSLDLIGYLSLPGLSCQVQFFLWWNANRLMCSCPGDILLDVVPREVLPPGPGFSCAMLGAGPLSLLIMREKSSEGLLLVEHGE